MGLGNWLTSLLQPHEAQAEESEEEVRFECPTCGSTFEQPAGADLCPMCYKTGVRRIEA